MNSKSHIKSLLWVATFIAALSFFSCTTNSSTLETSSGQLSADNGWSNWGPTIPLHLKYQGTDIVIGDFLIEGEVVDSVVWHRSTKKSERLTIDKGIVKIITPTLSGIGMLSLHINGNVREVPVFESNETSVTVKVESSKVNNAKELYIAGAMNGWSAFKTPMKKGSDGNWSADFILPNGIHQYQIVTDGLWGLNPSCPDSISNGMGGWNSVISIIDPISPPVIRAELTEKEDVIKVLGEDGVEVWVWWEDRLVTEFEIPKEGSSIISLPEFSSTLRRSHVRIFCVNKGVRGDDLLIPLEFGSPITNATQLDRRDWHSMIMYFLMIDRFENIMPQNDSPVNDPEIAPIANHMGGDLAGVALKIEDGYLENLGVNTVWLSPITQNAEGTWGHWQDPRTDIYSKFSSYHGYWPISNTKINSAFGTRAEFNGLVDLAHSKDMNVILDYVANHVHEDHPVYKLHPDWATNLYLPDGSMNTERWDDHRLTTWFDTFLPTLDLSKPEVYSAMSDSALWWVENSAIDGFRHDATKHIPEIFWRTLTTKLKTLNKSQNRRVFQIGETYGSPSLISSYISSGMLDAQFDFNHYDAIVGAIAYEEGSFENLVSIATESLKAYGAHNLMGNITGNQDRSRFTSLADGGVSPKENGKYQGWTSNITHQGDDGYAKMRLLMSYLMSMPGIPCIYYGDEIADVGANDPDNRRMMRFTGLNKQELSTLKWTSDWTKLRSSRLSLIYGSTQLKAISPTLLRIDRTYLDETTTILINKASTPASISMSLIPSNCKILAGEIEVVQNQLVVPPLSAVAIE